MPILFKPEFVEKILSGEKTVTRRRWKSARVKVGNVYQARIRLFVGEPFAWLRVKALHYEPLVGACPGDPCFGCEGLREGCGPNHETAWDAFAGYFAEMHGAAALYQPCYRVEFEVVEKPADQTTKAR